MGDTTEFRVGDVVRHFDGATGRITKSTSTAHPWVGVSWDDHLGTPTCHRDALTLVSRPSEAPVEPEWVVRWRAELPVGWTITARGEGQAFLRDARGRAKNGFGGDTYSVNPFQDVRDEVTRCAGFLGLPDPYATPAAPAWLREQLKALPVGATWKIADENKTTKSLYLHIHLQCKCWTSWWVRERESLCMTVAGALSSIAEDCPHAATPTIDDEGAAVLPIPQTDPPDPQEVLGCGGYYGGECKLQREHDGPCNPSPRDVAPPDLSLTNEIGLPTLPPGHRGACETLGKRGSYPCPECEGPRPGDVVSWEAVVGVKISARPSSGPDANIYETQEGLVVPEWNGAKPDRDTIFARRKVQDSEGVWHTGITVVAVERCTVVRKAATL